MATKITLTLSSVKLTHHVHPVVLLSTIFSRIATPNEGSFPRLLNYHTHLNMASIRGGMTKLSFCH